jgi:hypothetical protein
MLRARSRRKSLGITLIEVMTATSIMAGLQAQSGGNLRYAVSQAREVRGISNLRQIYQLLLIQSMTGRLPKAAFYPKDDPLKDPKSIVNKIQGAPKEMFISPFAPEPLRKKGLTYAWNDTVNGKTLDSVGGNTWLLIDLAAFIADPKVDRPRKYLVLYANGAAKAVRQPPADIVKAVKKARAAKGGKGAEETEEPREKPPEKTRSRGGVRLPNLPGLR